MNDEVLGRIFLVSGFGYRNHPIDFKVEVEMVMTLLTRGWQPVGSHVLFDLIVGRAIPPRVPVLRSFVNSRLGWSFKGLLQS